MVRHKRSKLKKHNEKSRNLLDDSCRKLAECGLTGMGRIHKVSRQIECGANRLARFSTRIHFVRWWSTSKVWRTFVEGKKGNYALPSLLGVPWVLYKNGFM